MFIYILVLLTCFSFVLTQEFGAPVPQPERVPQVLLQSVNNVGLFLNTFHDVNNVDGLEQIEQFSFYFKTCLKIDLHNRKQGRKTRILYFLYIKYNNQK